VLGATHTQVISFFRWIKFSPTYQQLK